MEDFVSLPLTKPVQQPWSYNDWGRQDKGGSINIDGIQRPTMPFVGQAEGKGRFLNVTCLCCQTSQL